MSDGTGCKCAASSAADCSCNVEWTPAELVRLRAENKRLRGDHIACHQGRDILASLYEAWNNLPACGMLAIIGGACQEIDALRSGEFVCRKCGNKTSLHNLP